MKQKELFAAVRALGLTITRTEGGDEYRLAFPLAHYGGSRAYQTERQEAEAYYGCLLYTSPSPRDVEESRMPSSA